MTRSFEDALVEALAAHEEAGLAGVERVLAFNPEHAERLSAHLERLHGFGFLGDGEQVVAPKKTAGTFPERLGEFRLLQRLGGGGMGVVYLAEQMSLARRVALKLVRPENLYFPGAQERFRREVESIAKLQHPGIVPVFSAGEDAGIPWLAMEHVEGASLDEVLRSLVGRDPAHLTGEGLSQAVAHIVQTRAITPSAISKSPPATGDSTNCFSGPWSSSCLRIIRAIAVALAHAHERGVLHRDVKPSNVMLTLDGRAQLLDFGLALSDGSSRLTGTGSQLGSPAYMSPEQMRGDPGQVGARSDIYSLGVTLYELLTLRMPFAGDSVASTRDLVLAGNPAPMRLLNRTIARDVEVVCKKAMDVDAGRRYSTAAAFAADLDNLLALRPVAAQPPSALLIARRWAQRHPARAIAGVAGVLLFVVTPTGFLLQQHAANREIRQALANAKEQRNRAREAVDTMLTRVANEDLLKLPRMLGVRRDLLNSARDFYERFLAESADDPELQEQTAEAALQLSSVESDLGEMEKSLAAATRAEGLARTLGANGGNAKSRNLMVSALIAKGVCQQTLARAPDALRSLEEARTCCEAALAISADDAELWTSRLSIERLLAMSLSKLERHDDSVACYRHLFELWTRAAPRIRDSKYHAQAIDGVLGGAADEASYQMSQHDAEAVREALDRGQQLVLAATGTEASPTSRLAVARLALTRAELAAVETDPEEQEAGYRDALTTTRSLLDDYPDHSNALATRAATLNQLALFLDRADRGAEALPLYQESIAISRRMIQVDPAVVENRANLAATLVNVGALQMAGGGTKAVRETFEEAVTLATGAVALFPARTHWRTIAHNALWYLGETCGAQGDHAGEAAAAEQLATVQPDNAQTQRIAAELLAHSIQVLANDATLPEEQRMNRKQELESKALTFLRDAAKLGYSDFERLASGAKLEPLRSLPGFAEILEQVEANAAAGKSK